jgi:hypothetical protein
MLARDSSLNSNAVNADVIILLNLPEPYPTMAF